MGPEVSVLKPSWSKLATERCSTHGTIYRGVRGYREQHIVYYVLSSNIYTHWLLQFQSKIRCVCSDAC